MIRVMIGLGLTLVLAIVVVYFIVAIYASYKKDENTQPPKQNKTNNEYDNYPQD